jgi:hypothetical protein
MLGNLPESNTVSEIGEQWTETSVKVKKTGYLPEVIKKLNSEYYIRVYLANINIISQERSR